MGNENEYIRFDWAMKHMLRDKSNFEILEGLISVLIGQDIKIKQILESESNQEVLNMTPADRAAYFRHLDNLMQNNDTLDTECDADRKEGREEEMKRSFRTMLAFGIPVESIADKYGLTAEEVKRLASLD